MLRNGLFLIVFILFFLNTSKAIVGPFDLVRQGGSESSCLIIVRNSMGQLQSTCSGVLISEAVVASAAHCLKPDFKTYLPYITIRCGFLGIDTERLEAELTPSGNKTITKGTLFRDESNVRDAKRDNLVLSDPSTFSKDLSVFFLSTKMKSTPVLINTELPLLPDTECMLSSFGVSNSFDPGVLNSGPFLINNSEIQDGLITVFRSVIVAVDEYNKTKADIIDPSKLMVKIFSIFSPRILGTIMPSRGDSGGPLLCKRPKEKDYSLLGILSRTGHVTRNRVAEGELNLLLSAGITIVNPTFLTDP